MRAVPAVNADLVLLPAVSPDDRGMRGVEARCVSLHLVDEHLLVADVAVPEGVRSLEGPVCCSRIDENVDVARGTGREAPVTDGRGLPASRWLMPLVR